MIEQARPLIYMEFNAWTLNAFGGHSPAAFAKALFRAFDIQGRINPLGFLHQHLIEEGCVSDLRMTLRAGIPVPGFAEMSGYAKHGEDLDALTDG